MNVLVNCHLSVFVLVFARVKAQNHFHWVTGASLEVVHIVSPRFAKSHTLRVSKFLGLQRRLLYCVGPIHVVCNLHLANAHFGHTLVEGGGAWNSRLARMHRCHVGSMLWYCIFWRGKWRFQFLLERRQYASVFNVIVTAHNWISNRTSFRIVQGAQCMFAELMVDIGCVWSRPCHYWFTKYFILHALNLSLYLLVLED